jgi:hypothetical protein
MGPELNLETPDDVICPSDTQLPGVNASESQNPNASEHPTKKRKERGTYSDVWKHFKNGPLGDDGSYEALCNYYGKYYKQENQRSTSSLKHHIKNGCKKISWEKRHNKIDALQKMLQAGNTTGD